MTVNLEAIGGLTDWKVRAARPGDEPRLLTWRNDPMVMQLGLSRRNVTSEEHHRWFCATLAGAERELFLVEIDGMPAGMIRYDFDEDEAEVSLYLLPPFPGRGYGEKMFLATAPDMMIRRGLRRITARVRKENARSLTFFRRLGFQEDSASSGEGEAHSLILDRPPVPHSRPWVGEAEVSAVAAVLNSRQIAQGPRVMELERNWCEATGTQAAAAVGSGLAAMRLALAALEVGPGDEVILPAYSCVALLNAVLAMGATPVLADVLLDRWTLAPESVRDRLTRQTKAILAVHLFGYPADMSALGAMGVPVIEDCAHGIGGRCGGAAFGSAGTLSMASFYATKMLGGSEGGIVAGHSPALVDRIRQARDYSDQLPDAHRLNDKMSDLEAVLASEQLKRLPETLRRRADRARIYGERLRPLAEEGLLVLPSDEPGRVWYRYVVRLTHHKAPDLAVRLCSHGIRGEQPVWDLRTCSYWREGLDGATAAFDRLLSLPLYPDLSDMEQGLVCSAVGSSVRDARN